MTAMSSAPAKLIPALLLALVATPHIHGQEARVTLEGRSDQLSDLFTVESGLLLVGGAHRGSANFIVQLLSVDGSRVATAVNTIGDYQGVRLLPVDAGQYRIQVQAQAPWFVMYEPVDPSKAGTPLPVAEERRGDTPMGPITLNTGLLRGYFTHDGEANFIVTLFRADGRRVGSLLNHIGNYEGTVSMSIREAGEYYIGLQADGNWSMRLEMDETTPPSFRGVRQAAPHGTVLGQFRPNSGGRR